TPGTSAFGRMPLVISTDREHVAPRRIKRRKDLQVLKPSDERRATRDFRRRQELPDMVQADVPPIDHAQQVRQRRALGRGDLDEIHNLVEVGTVYDAQPTLAGMLEHQQSHCFSTSEPADGDPPVPAPKNSSSKSWRPRSSPG